ncbi:MAG: ATP-binding cassette domain-containing protein [Rickettsia sp.]
MAIVFGEDYPDILKDIEAITSNFFIDLHSTFTVGILQLGHLTTQKIIQLIALRDIMNLVPGAIIFNEFENIKQGFLNILYQLDISYRNEAEKINENKASIVRNIASNTSNILLTDAAQFVQNQYAEQLKATKEISKKMLFLDSTRNTITTILDISDKFIKSLYYIYKVKNEEITLEQALLLNPWLETLTPFLTSSSLKIIFSGAVISQARITKLIEAIASENKKGITWSINDTNDELVISDYNLIIEETTILNFEKLVLKLGAHYLLSASSGKGKTTFLKSLVNCIADPCHSVGEISIPTHYQNPKIIFIDQNSYIPVQSTLFEVITSGLDQSIIKSNKQSLEEKINTLFIKLDLGTLITHLSDKNYDVINAPSGGQKKKIGIIKAIISNPKILILDEVFANLDNTSIENAQQALKKLLPETLMLVVHHDSKSHDYNNFYDQYINLEDLYAEIKLLGK